jgi:hypothetical protein
VLHLSIEDVQCFKCLLPDCRERYKQCLRKKAITEQREHKQIKVHFRYKSIFTVLPKPVVVR